MKEATALEIAKLNQYHSICLQALREFSTNHPQDKFQLDKERIELLLNRMFDGEKDYLLENPDDYSKLYDEQCA